MENKVEELPIIMLRFRRGTKELFEVASTVAVRLILVDDPSGKYSVWEEEKTANPTRVIMILAMKAVLGALENNSRNTVRGGPRRASRRDKRAGLPKRAASRPASVST